MEKKQTIITQLTQQHIIQIDWDGPYGLDQLNELNDIKTDRGVYQVYGYHPIYRSNVLLYIGKTESQTFGKRLKQEKWDQTNNYHDIRFYVGRISGETTPSLDEWKREISLAESLLIYSHQPAINTIKLKQMKQLTKEALQNVHILNWGLYNHLLPEVSGVRWFNAFPVYEVYGDHDEI